MNRYRMYHRAWELAQGLEEGWRKCNVDKRPWDAAEEGDKIAELIIMLESAVQYSRNCAYEWEGDAMLRGAVAIAEETLEKRTL